MRKFLIIVIAVISLITATAYFVSCLTPYISPVYFWPMAFFALGFPYLAVVMLALVFLWVFLNKKVSLFLLIIFFVGFQNLAATFALSTSKEKHRSKETTYLRVLTWNVRGFDNPSITPDSASSVRTQMFNYIANVNADVVCLQEFTEHKIRGALSNTNSLRKLGYHYFYRTDENFQQFDYGTIKVGSAIFSKIPITDSGKVMLGDPTYPEHLAFVDVAFQGKTARIFSTHFKSINLFAVPNTNPNRVIFYGDSNFVYYSTKYEKLKAFGQAHAREARIAKDAMKKSPHPAILGVDMNSVPTSYAYYVMSAGLQDAFIHKGFGLGATMIDLPKTLRIDFLLIDKKLAIKNYSKTIAHLSDHYPQYVDVGWKK